jgi:hypothetical protein
MDEDEKLELTCPLCGKEHTYTLDVDRSFVLFQMTITALGSSKKTAKQFKRIFFCPDKNKKFQAIIKMSEGSGEVINDVSARVPESEQ